MAQRSKEDRFAATMRRFLAVKKCLEMLPGLQAEALMSHLSGEPLAAAAKGLGVTKARYRQILAKASQAMMDMLLDEESP